MFGPVQCIFQPDQNVLDLYFEGQGISALWTNAALQLLSVTGGGGNFWVFWPRSSPLLLT